jgi:rubredoxin
LPDDWCCPECGAEKEYFEELDDWTKAVELSWG